MTLTHARIHRLAPHTANQIAAGEVVERPASVVKECVENSIDAGATKIKVIIEKGGIGRIVVQDDGAGIDKDDLQLAVSRHATSKITNAQDLLSIGTLGFRGEALASIASVSHFTLTSRTADSDCAWQITVDDMAHCTDPTPAALPFGTCVEVRGLFYNTPARRKFLRADRTEAQQIQETIKRLALSHFNVAITLVMDDKIIYQLPALNDAAQFATRIQKIHGKAFLEHCFAIDIHAPGLRLWGWLGEPSFTRSQADSQYFFINGRVVRDKLMNHAMRQVYQEVIYPGRYPLYVLYLECDPKECDVNVHPTKHEVRFHNSRLIHDFITQKLTPIVLNQPQSSEWIPPIEKNENSPITPTIDRPQTSYDYRAHPASDVQTIIQTHQAILIPERLMQQRYAVFVLDKTLWLVDCVALMQHLFLKHIQQHHSLPTQALLLPERFTLTEHEMQHLKSKLTILENLGIVCQPIDAKTVVVKQWPKDLPCVGVPTCLQRLLKADDERSRQQALSQIANDIAFSTYSAAEWQAIWTQLTWQPNDEVDNPYPAFFHCHTRVSLMTASQLALDSV